MRPNPSAMPIPRTTATVLAYSRVEPTLTPSAVLDGCSTWFTFWSTPYPATAPAIKLIPSTNGPTRRHEESETAARANAAKYIEERNNSWTVSVRLMLQVIDRPLTATSTTRSPTSTQTILGTSAKYPATNRVIKTRPRIAAATGNHRSMPASPRLSTP